MVQDWIGNLVKNGHEFCIVRISPIYRLKFTGMMWLHAGWENKVVPNKEYWEPGPYYKVSNGCFTYERNEEVITNYIEILDRELYKDDRYIIAIRDISDIKELYYGKALPNGF